MRSAARTILIGILALLGTSAAAPAAPSPGTVRGAVTDTSGGVLPGVTVTATSADGRVVATAVTDEAGGFTIESLPAGRLRLAYELEGFAGSVAALTIESGVESLVEQQLALAPVKEIVEVVGMAPVEPPPPLPPPPPPVVIPVPIHDRESVCGPAKRTAETESFGTIVAHRNDAERELYAKDDQVTIDGGAENLLEVGQNLVARRYYRAAPAMTGEHTSGLVQIVAVDESTATGVVVYACDELRKGDFLAAFNPEPMRAADPGGVADFDEPARILFADAGQMLGIPRRLMVIDQGSDAGVHVGQRLTLFRQPKRDGKRSIVGDAIVVAVRADSATIRVERATDAIQFGDWAAPQRLSRASR
jgi:carboxypeptidase family protein